MEWHTSDVTITIHRGTHQIGGSCIELAAEGSRLILDLGLPLNLPDDAPPPGDLLNMGALVQSGVAPDVRGLYFDEPPTVDAVVLSHVHQDHTGLGRYIHPDVPVHATAGTWSLLDVSAIFLPHAKAPARRATLPKHTPVGIGPFRVTALPVDHAAPDSVALLVEAGGKRVLYTGDLRAHGRTSYRFDQLLAHPPAFIDALIIEGTTLSRPDAAPESEVDLEQRLAALFRAQKDLSLVFCSPQNLDRIVSIFKAARAAGKHLVIDLYTAYTMHALREVSKNVPQADWNGISVVPWRYQQSRLEENGQATFTPGLAGHRIGYPGIVQRRREIVLLARSNSRLQALASHLGPELGDLQVIWSQWAGYWPNDRYARPFCEAHGIEKIDVHTSGHASWADLQRLVEAVAPKIIVPVHTTSPERYEQRFSNVVRMQDGVPIGC